PGTGRRHKVAALPRSYPARLVAARCSQRLENAEFDGFGDSPRVRDLPRIRSRNDGWLSTTITRAPCFASDKARLEPASPPCASSKAGADERMGRDSPHTGTAEIASGEFRKVPERLRNAALSLRPSRSSSTSPRD